MWKDAWKNTVLICGDHGQDMSHRMEPARKKETICYCCEAGNKESDADICGNQLSVLEFEKMLGEMDEASGDIFDESSLVGYKWKQKDHSFCVMEERHGKFTVLVTTIGKDRIL